MNNKQKNVLGISLIASAVTMLFTLIIAPSKSKKLARVLGVLALLEGLAGLCVATEAPRRLLRRKKAKAMVEDEELFDEDEADEVDSVIYSELSHTGEAESGAQHLHIEIPCDEDASEEDFV